MLPNRATTAPPLAVPADSSWLDRFERLTFLDNPVWVWLAAILVSAAAFVAIRLLIRGVTSRFRRLAEGKSYRVLAFIRAMLDAVLVVSIVGVSLWIGAQLLELPARAESVVRGIVIVIVALQVASLASAALRFSTGLYVDARAGGKPEEVASLRTTMGAVNIIGVLAIYLLMALLALQNLGIEVMPLIAGLGIGGIAIALAVQNILSDLFASLSIVLDQPFVVGDFIIVGEQLGTVEKIGLKTTRVRSLWGEQLVFSNTDLLQSRIRNFKRMAQRRVVFSFSVVLHTPPEALERIGPMVREIISGIEGTTFDRAHFHKFGASSLDFEVVYYTLSPDYNRYMDVQQRINLELVRRFRAEGIRFAYPAQTVFVQDQSVAAGTGGHAGRDGNGQPV